MSSIFGGSSQQGYNRSSSNSSNRAFPILNNRMTDTSAQLYNRGGRALANQLGGGFEKYKNQTGFNFMERLGLNRVAGSYSGRGAFGSGAAMKSLAQYENNLEKQSYNDYLDRLMGSAGLGQQGFGTLASAGGTSRSTSSGTTSGSSSNGAGGFLGALAAGLAACDRRLKENIEKVGVVADTGLGLYKFNYKGDDITYVGPMADEVAELYPEALGPVVDGYNTVDLAKLDELVGE